MRTLLLLTLFITTVFGAAAQKGQLAGKVTDAKNAEELMGATIVIDGTTTATITDFSGDYILPNINPGTYTIKCQLISYEPAVATQVVIKSGETTKLNLQMKPVELDLQEVKVVGKINRSNETMLLMEQKNAVVATQAIGSQELSRKGASDAEAAVTKVSGISKQEGVKNVFVRGLGDRYNATNLNGFPVPSEDPEYKNISLDFFSSDMIQSVGVNKVFASGATSDVAGAEINIVSKELTTNSELAIGAKVGANLTAINETFLKTDGVNSFGFANKTPGPDETAYKTQYDFSNKLDPTTHQNPIDNGFSISGGKKLTIGENLNPLSFYVLASYDNSFEYNNGITRNTTTTGNIFKDMTYDRYKQNSTHMVLGNVNYRFKNNTISYNALYVHSNIQYFSNYVGLNSNFEDVDSNEGLLRRQQINDNSLIVNQLSFNSKVNDRLTVDAGASLNMIFGNEPDRRMNFLSKEESGNYHPTKGTARQQRYFSELNETDLNLKLGAKYKLSATEENKSSIGLGYIGRFVDRAFEAIEYDHKTISQPSIASDNILLDNFFNQDSLNSGAFQVDRNIDEYSVEKYVHGAYADYTFQLGAKTTGVASIRFDDVYMNIPYNVNRGGTKGTATISETYLLPSLNIKYDLNDKNAFRFGASRTYTLPQALEIAPFRYQGPDYLVQGNPNLKPTSSNNIDIKWDYYLSSDELISMTVFHKLLKDPISRTEKASAGGYLTYDNIDRVDNNAKGINSDYCTVKGIELEIRKNIFKNDDSKLSFGLNGSYIISNINLDTQSFTNSSSQLEGASPFIANADLSHNIAKNDFSLTNTLVYNYFSDRIFTIGTQGYQDIVENGLGTLDYIASCKLNKHFGISFKAKNLTNPIYQHTRQANSSNEDPIVLKSYQKGVTLSMGLSYKL